MEGNDNRGTTILAQTPTATSSSTTQDARLDWDQVIEWRIQERQRQIRQIKCTVAAVLLRSRIPPATTRPTRRRLQISASPSTSEDTCTEPKEGATNNGKYIGDKCRGAVAAASADVASLGGGRKTVRFSAATSASATEDHATKAATPATRLCPKTHRLSPPRTGTSNGNRCLSRVLEEGEGCCEDDELGESTAAAGNMDPQQTRSKSFPGDNNESGFRPEVNSFLEALAKRSPSAHVIQKEFRYFNLRKVEQEARRYRRVGPLSILKHRPNNKPYNNTLILEPDVCNFLIAHSKRSPSANIIKKEFRYASLRKVNEEERRRQSLPLLSTGSKDAILLDHDFYNLLVARHHKRSPCANVIKKEFRSVQLRKVEDEPEHSRRRSMPLVVSTSTSKDLLLLDPHVYDLLVTHSKRSPSANIIKKEFRYARLRHVRSGSKRDVYGGDDEEDNHENNGYTSIWDDDDDDGASLSSHSTVFSKSFVCLEDDDDDDDDSHVGYHSSWAWMDHLEPIMAQPSMFPYYESSGLSLAGRRMSGSTQATSMVSVAMSVSRRGDGTGSN